MVDKYLDRAGLGSKNYSVHKLRHTAATLMYREGGVDVRVLKEILGHEQLNTCLLYTSDPRAVDEKARFLHAGEHRGKRHFDAGKQPLGIRRAQLFLKNGFHAEGELDVAAGRVVTEILRSE